MCEFTTERGELPNLKDRSLTAVLLLCFCLLSSEEAGVVRITAHGVGGGGADDDVIQQLNVDGAQGGEQVNGEIQILGRGLGFAAGMVVGQHNGTGVIPQNMLKEGAPIYGGQVDAAAAYGVGLQNL